VKHEKVVIAGGSGFLGRSLSKWLIEKGYEVCVLSRGAGKSPEIRRVLWDARNLGDWVGELDGAKALVNLTGRWVNCRYTKKNRRDIMESRTLSTRILGEGLNLVNKPPEVWLNSSTATIYLHRFDKANDEEKGIIGSHRDAKDKFSVDVAESWEKEFNAVICPSTRKITMRTSFIFGPEPGGAYETFRKLVLLRLGGKMGHGRQFVSWMHSDDFCKSIEWLINNERATGVYNLCSANPLTNGEMMAGIRNVLGVGYGFSPSRWLLELGAFFLRTETELIIKSRYVYPKRLLEEGFVFDHPDFEAAIRDIERSIIR